MEFFGVEEEGPSSEKETNTGRLEAVSENHVSR